MSLTILRMMLVCGIIGHAINLYCDRIISIFPNGALKLDDVKSIGKDDKLARLLEGVSEKIPLRSGILGAFALLLEFFGYFALSVYMYEQSKVYGSILFLAAAFFIVIGTAHHVLYCLVEYIFIRLGRDDFAGKVMMELFNNVTCTMACYIGYIVFVATLIIAILTGVAAFPLWGVIFTVLPIFLVMSPLRITGTLHYSAMVSMLAWMFFIS